MIAAYRPDRTRVAAFIFQDGLNISNGARIPDLSWKGCDSAIVIPNHVFHLSLPGHHQRGAEAFRVWRQYRCVSLREGQFRQSMRRPDAVLSSLTCLCRKDAHESPHYGHTKSSVNTAHFSTAIEQRRI